MQIPILNGIGKDWLQAYPVNMIPVPVPTGISAGHLRPADGILELVTGPGLDRGGINWLGECYRVMGTSLIKVASNGVITVLGTIPGSDTVSMDYGFGRLAIAADGKLFYWAGTLTQVTDPDLGSVVDVVWVDGYYMVTDGVSLVVTELTDPTQVNPLKYGSSEADPDPVKALVKIRNEVYVINRYTIEVFNNVGGDYFPFARVEGGQVQKGCVGTHTNCAYLDTVAFLGSGRNESLGIYLGSNSMATKISTHAIDSIINAYPGDLLESSELESRNDGSNQFLYVHLPDRTLVYDAIASRVVGQPVWSILTSSSTGFSQYRARHMVWCYDKWISGDTLTYMLGYFTLDTGNHYGTTTRWEFQTEIIYNGSRGALFREIELVALTGEGYSRRTPAGENPTISTSYSLDGETWSQEKYRRAGKIGDRRKRLIWYQQGSMRTWRIQRFRGDSDSSLRFARLEAQIEPLGV